MNSIEDLINYLKDKSKIQNKHKSRNNNVLSKVQSLNEK